MQVSRSYLQALSINLAWSAGDLKVDIFDHTLRNSKQGHKVSLLRTPSFSNSTSQLVFAIQ